MCLPLCAHISISLQGPLLGDSHQAVGEHLAQKPVTQSLTYCVTLGKLVITCAPWVAFDLPNIAGFSLE